MMSFSIKLPELPDRAFCFNLQRVPRPHGGDVLKMSCPVLMPNMSAGVSSSSYTIRNVFLNASACKPAVPSSVSLQSYIPFTCQYNSDFEHLVDIVDYLPAMTRLKCELTNNLPFIRTFTTDY